MSHPAGSSSTPKRRTRRRARWPAAPACGLAALLAFGAAGAGAGGDNEQDRVRDAVRSGEVMSFDVLRQRLLKSHPGEVLELELERDREQGRWIYEIKLLQPDGRIVKLELDARSGDVLRERRGRTR
ncbi:MAG TPA: PepSY domain-containing protein [Rubrivivax sp.]|nr:PepSY domain-containing protein [Rubrivivax sp.]HPO20426.1 PepSY domain-containing protein [Rubrivivax sp.]